MVYFHGTDYQPSDRVSVFSKDGVMEYRKLGDSDLGVSIIGFWAWED
jgi:hypothetical protein